MESSKLQLPSCVYWMKWVLPASLIWVLVTATFIRSDESQLNYFVSISSFFFLMLNVFYSWIASLNFAAALSKETNLNNKVLTLFIGLVLNVWGQYYFRRKFSDIVRLKSFSIYDIFYLFFIFIIAIVSVLMSEVVS